MIPAVTLHADPLGLLVAFGAGMLSFISPCVLPLVPGYVSMISGMSAAELDALRPIDVSEAATDPGGDVLTLTEVERRTERTRLLRGILLFIAGFTVVFTMLGASASVVGHVLTTHKRELEMVSGILIVAFGTLMVSMAAGVRLPSAVGRERRFAVRPSVLGAWAPPVMGVAFAFAWTPCIGPVLGSVLALAAGTGGTTTGGIALLLAYSIGLGVPFLLFGLAFGRMTDLVGRVRGRLRYVDLVGGIVLIVFGVLLLTGNVDVLSAHISHFLDDLHLSRLSSS
jgi:cytochrome c-type biogenesis protein